MGDHTEMKTKDGVGPRGLPDRLRGDLTSATRAGDRHARDYRAAAAAAQ